ncbi:hypothetical protein XA68_14086 [Ophiocordyceps unilateralis]|uniref:Insulin-induced protein n=1 Tax=Ophiocordyceps unilateralis TaxID=268505 RepID=A0A2A9PB85_OPHUN|nr:hypothetical protein XA68_14086 [Ophiocordyceps unilateralis]
MPDEGPTILRPIPRRPFSLKLISATPPSEDDDAQLTDAGWQDPLAAGFLESDAASLSRQKSLMNLTSSTLMGIYSQAASDGCDRSLVDRDDADTPWGTRAQTLARPQSLDDATYQLMRHRSNLPQRIAVNTPLPSPTSSSAFALSARVVLLFLLGSGYGVLVTRLHGDERYRTHLTEGFVKPGLSCNYLACWGAFGAILGSLLPWFDKLWDDTLAAETDADEIPAESLGPGTDWALVMRAIGAFAGIVFAIRKLSWVSTLQISATLALANPLLWWLIDRSKVGLLLSAGVGVAGSVVLLSVNPSMMPAPSRALPHALAGRNMSASSMVHGMPSAVLGGLASRETVETGIWMLSVLFNSCVCFGNIGRRLALNEKAGVRGRWGGVR